MQFYGTSCLLLAFLNLTASLPSIKSKINKLDLISLSSKPLSLPLSSFFFLPLLGLFIGHHGLPQQNSLEKKLYDYIGQFFSPLLRGFRQGYSTQHVMLNFLQRCKKSVDNKGLAGPLFMDLSKVFDSISHDLLLAKLNAYGINLGALQLIESYL